VSARRTAPVGYRNVTKEFTVTQVLNAVDRRDSLRYCP